MKHTNLDNEVETYMGTDWTVVIISAVISIALAVLISEHIGLADYIISLFA